MLDNTETAALLTLTYKAAAFLLSKQTWLPDVARYCLLHFLLTNIRTWRYNTDLAYVPGANASQKFSNEWLSTLLPLRVCFNPHTHPCFCDVFNYVSPGSGDSALLIMLLSSLEQNYSTKRESSWLTMQLVIPTMCQNYDATDSLSLFLFTVPNLCRFVLFSLALSTLFISIIRLVMHCPIWDKKVIVCILTGS